MRLDKYLADHGYGTRSMVKKIIASGRVSINGELSRDGATHIPDKAVIKVSGSGRLDEKAGEQRYLADEDTFSYFMLNKPAGTVTANTDKSDRTVMDFFRDEHIKGLNPVGRLDKDTEGLLLITDDGELGHFLTSPKRNVPKKYYAELNGIPDQAGIERLKSGVSFKDFTARPAVLEIISKDEEQNTSTVFITVTEGRFHEVKRLALAIGCEVRYLKRVDFAGLKLDEDLDAGQYRRLTDTEIEMLRAQKTGK